MEGPALKKTAYVINMMYDTYGTDVLSHCFIWVGNITNNPPENRKPCNRFPNKISAGSMNVIWQQIFLKLAQKRQLWLRPMKWYYCRSSALGKLEQPEAIPVRRTRRVFYIPRKCYGVVTACFQGRLAWRPTQYRLQLPHTTQTTPNRDARKHKTGLEERRKTSDRWTQSRFRSRARSTKKRTNPIKAIPLSVWKFKRNINQNDPYICRESNTRLPPVFVPGVHTSFMRNKYRTRANGLINGFRTAVSFWSQITLYTILQFEVICLMETGVF